MLSFSIAVSPYKECFSIASLLGYVIGKRFLFLLRCELLQPFKLPGQYVYIIYSLDHLYVKEVLRSARAPLPIVGLELQSVEMANDTRHGYRAIAPGRSESEVKFIVLHILIPPNGSL